MNLPGFTAEFSLYGRTAGRPHTRPGLCGEQYGVIPQMTLVSVLCAEEYARCMEWCGLALIVSPGYCECMCRNIYCVCGGRRCLPKMCDPAQ
ncbi:hypothetical protein SAMN05216299_10662 [Nitrosospira sp. Nsp14]|nr:hypothetical protein SAMN05216299_10662 [Nitrosospira sp. Nsp14]